MKTYNKIFTGLALLSISSFALAGHYDSEYTYAQVVDVQPIYETYQIPQNNSQNRRACNDNYRGREYNASHRGNGKGAVIGGIIGGLIGNKFGKGHGKDASTAAGILVGAAIGSNAKHNNRRHYNNNRNCYSQTQYYEEQRITGYDVSYDYNGRIYQSRLQNHPGNRVKVQVTVQIAEY